MHVSCVIIPSRTRARQVMASVLLPAPPYWPDQPPLPVEMAPGTVSGFKGVHKVRDGLFQVRVHVAGKGKRVLCTAATAIEAAYIRARQGRHPCPVPSPAKQREARRTGSKREKNRAAARFARGGAAAELRRTAKAAQCQEQRKRSERLTEKLYGVPVDPDELGDECVYGVVVEVFMSELSCVNTRSTQIW